MPEVRQRATRKARKRLSCALVLGTVAAIGTAMPAQAQEGPAVPDPMTTNVPYTAWAGTQVRMVKCSPLFEGLRVGDLSVTVESWSGSPNYRPQVIEPSIDFIGSRSRDERCARFNVVSLGDGLARIKLKAFSPRPERLELLEHQFLGIWLQLGVPTIDEVGANDPTGGPVGSETEVGDPLGDGAFLPSSNNGRIQVMVTGSFPHPLSPSGRFTLPTDWATLAAALATSADPTDDNPTWRWDIHDDMLKTEGHVAGFCGPGAATVDAVDNCRGGDVRFSRVFGDFGREGGPFDPVRLPSLLSDGKVDAGDAPMPAARVDISIAPNTNPLTDIGGVGALEKADKTEVYSRDGNGTDSPHNLYAPYYEQYVPATAAEEDRDPASSGTDWFEQNNFGHDFFGLYDNWDTFPLKTALAMDTGCNRTVGFDGGEDEPRQTPAGAQTVAVATDEHGEAQVEYEPYAGGFYYDAVGAVLNANRGCDLQDVRVLGRSVISAVAKYPGQPVDFPAQRSGSLTKVVGNEFDKSLRWYPKGPGAANSNANIIVAHGQDVDGTPFAGERVCFIVDARADSRGQLFSGVIPTASGPFQVTTAFAPTPSRLDHNVLCGRLDANGNAAIEVFNSGDETINVIGYYIDEGLLRDIDVRFGAGDPGAPGDPPSTTPPPNTGGSTGPGTSTPSAGQVVQTAGSNAGQLLGSTKTANATKKTRLSKSRIVRVGAKRYLVVKVVSPAAKAKLAIRLKLRSGATLKATRTVKTNKTVRVMRLSSAVKSVKVSLK